MKICIDCRMWGKQFGGIGRYVQQIVSNFFATQNWYLYLMRV